MSEETKTLEPTETRVKIVSVKMSRQVDLGYVPYMAYLKKLGHRQPPFGTRDQSRVEYDVFLSAEVGTNDNFENVARELSAKGKALLDEFIANAHAATIKQAEEERIPEEAYTINQTTVEREVVGEF